MRFIWKFFTSLRLTVVLLALAVLLIFFGTLSQVDEGLWKAQKIWFESWVVIGQHLQLFGWKFTVPIFPGGYLIGTPFSPDSPRRSSTASPGAGTSSASTSRTPA